MPAMGVSSWANEGKAAQLMAEKTPKGVILKSFDWVLYPVLVTVTVMTHSVTPLKESVSLASVQVQSPDFFAIV